MKTFHVLGTPLLGTNYRELIAHCQQRLGQSEAFAIDFSNSHIVAMRRRQPEFRETTSRVDHFVPDGMPLVWCLNWRGAGMADRVYGPTFMRECVLASPEPFTHYFLGGSDDCVNRLVENFCSRNSSIRIIGLRSGYFKPEEEPAIVEEINRLGPDFVWVGLGTPKQQEWIYRWKPHIRRGAVMAVGFAFDVNSGTKKDAPPWMQRRGLTWMYRLLAEPRRLAGRYLRYNSLFLFYLIWDGICGRAFVPGEPDPRRDTRSDGRPAP